ncbi:hypothetical protein AAG906_032852 [Vitis piasezkii]
MVEKILVTVPERFEASITTLENTKDLSMITLVELLNALQDYAIEGALPVKHHVVDQVKNQLFVTTCFFVMESSESWLIYSGCTNHMTHEQDLFRELRSTNTLKVQFGNGQYITVEGKRTVAISSCSGTKLISDVLYVPEIDQNYKVVFEDKSCLIKDARENFALNPLEDEKIAFPIKENITEVWHKRFGHYHHQGLLQMKSKMMANNLPDLDDHIPNCKACQFGKQNRKPFPKVT